MGTKPGAPLLQLAGDALTQRILDSVADGVLAYDRECRYTLWNPAMERISGLSATEVLGRSAFDLFPFLVNTGANECFLATLEGRNCTAKDQRFDVPESGRTGLFDGHYSPLQDANGDIVGGIAIIRDVTEKRAEEEERLNLARAEAARIAAEATAQRFEFLAEASEILASSLDYEETLRVLARLAIRFLGDLCIVDVVEEGEIRRVAMAHRRAEKAAIIDELYERFRPNTQSPHPSAHVVRTKLPGLYPVCTPELIEAHCVDAEHVRLIRQVEMRSHLAVPVVARGTVVGVISISVTESDRRLDQNDLNLATDLARRAALAIDNALLYRASQTELAERRRVAEELRLSEQRFREMFEQSPMSAQLFTPDGETTQVNAAWEKLLGVPLEVVQRAGYNVLRDPQLDALGVTPYLERAAKGEAVTLPVVRYDPPATLPNLPVKPADAIWVRAQAYPIKNTQGEVREVVLVHEDVSATVVATEQVRASEERLRIALESARMFVWDIDYATRRMVCSETAREIYGFDAGTLDQFVARIHPDDHANILAPDTGNYQAEFRILGQNGEPDRWVQSRGHVTRDPRDRVRRARGVTVDITERKTAEIATEVLADAGQTLNASLDALATLRELARVVVPRLGDWCTVDLLDERGELERLVVVHSDPALVREAMEITRTYSPTSPGPVEIRRVIETGVAVFQPEMTAEVVAAYAVDDVQRAKLERLRIRSRICVPLIVRGKGIGALTLAQAESRRRYTKLDLDIAKDLARRAAVAVENAQLYERVREEDRRKGEFLATLAHELRNPLAPVRTALDVLRTPPSLGEAPSANASTQAIYAMMERQIGHVSRLIDDLFDVSRVSRGKISLHRESLDVAALVEHALEAAMPMLSSAELSVVNLTPDVKLVVDGDATRLELVLSNLLVNAAKYTPRGGKVTVDVRRDGSEVELRLADTGIGIAPDMLGRVFEMFVQEGRENGEHAGLGIGLAMVRRLVDLHGGRVWAESGGPGKGSTFIVRLPLATSPTSVPRSPSSAARRALSRASRRILLVDDNVDAARMLAVLLELDGHVVRRATSGPEALEELRTFAAEVALLDIGLPGMSGLELARHIRADPKLAGIYLVAITGLGQAQDRRRSHEAGFDAHLTKPTEADDLALVIASFTPPEAR